MPDYDNFIPFSAGTVDLGFRCEFTPQPDITAYELAQLLPFIHGAPMTEGAWSTLGVTTRHLKRNA